MSEGTQLRSYVCTYDTVYQISLLHMSEGPQAHSYVHYTPEISEKY